MQPPPLEIKLDVVCSHSGEYDRTREGQGDVRALQAEKDKGEYNPPGGRSGVARVGKHNGEVSVSTK